VVVTWTTYTWPNAPTHHSTAHSAPPYHQKLTTTIFKLSTFTASGLFFHIPLQLSNIFYPFSTDLGLLTPFPSAGNLPPLTPYTNLLTLQPPFVQSLFLLVYSKSWWWWCYLTCSER